ncbi:ankyrin repeat domain-containing protein, partial [Planktomarina temperata]|nr:ankyrin repeat domain-containing protein [Planktomarina temperata]
MTRITCALAAVLSLVFTPLDAQNFLQKGIDAYEVGDFARAIKELTPLADQGDVNALNLLGYLHESGQGVPQDYVKAMRLYRLAADQGFAIAQNNLGTMYVEGRGTPKNYPQALKWYRLAADQGDARGQSNLGYMYYFGEGVPLDYNEAFKWSRLAAEQGYARAQARLGYMYRSGEGVAQDYAEGTKWYRLAAEQGHVKAQKTYCDGWLSDRLSDRFWKMASLQMVSDCFNYGADVNAKNDDGDTPLMVAIRLNNRAIATVLLEAGADLNTRNEDGNTSFHFAAEKAKKPEFLTVLLEA